MAERIGVSSGRFPSYKIQNYRIALRVTLPFSALLSPILDHRRLRLTLRSYVVDKYVTLQKMPIPVHIDKLFELPTTLCTLELNAATTAADVGLT